MKMMLGFSSLAVLKSLLISFYDSPINLHIRSADETLKKVPLSMAVAQALAR